MVALQLSAWEMPVVIFVLLNTLSGCAILLAIWPRLARPLVLGLSMAVLWWFIVPDIPYNFDCGWAWPFCW